MQPTFTFFGRASYYNDDAAKTSAYYKKNDNLLLINCGLNVFDEIKNINLLHNIKNVYFAITYMHKNHIADLPKILKCCKSKNIATYIIETPVFNAKNLYSIENQQINNPLKDYVTQNLGLIKNLDYILINKTNESLNKFVELDYKQILHMEFVESYSFLLNINNKKIFYSGDRNTIPFDIKNFDEYYLEVSPSDYHNVHLSLVELADVVKKNNIDKSKPYLMHFESTEFINEVKKLGYQIAPKINLEQQKEM